MRKWIPPALVAGALLIPRAATTHDVDVTSVARVFLEQTEGGRYVLSIVDTKVPPIRDPRGVLPPHCAPLARDESPVRVTRGFAFECDHELTFDDTLTLPWRLSGVVVLARWSDGAESSAYFRGRGETVLVHLSDLRAGASTVLRLAGRYGWLGVEHILLGIDHLLFVLGLLVLVHGLWPLVKTITAFTVAHSITLGAAVIGLIPVDRGPVEAAIALSIVLLAREIVVGHRGQVHLVHRHPWLVAFAFGLLHGLGFAGALSEIGLPAGDVPMALLFFNVGVEAGQLVFVVLLLGLSALVQNAFRRIESRRFEPVLGYALGALAVLWLFQRLPAVWGV